MRRFYLLLAVIGAVVPYSQFVPWVVLHGIDIPLLLRDLFATRLGAFFGLDVILSAVVLLVFIQREAVKRGIRGRWLPMAATCVIGVSCGLPLFLYLRERQRPAGT